MFFMDRWTRSGRQSIKNPLTPHNYTNNTLSESVLFCQNGPQIAFYDKFMLVHRLPFWGLVLFQADFIIRVEAAF